MFRFADDYFKSGLTQDGELAKKLAFLPDDLNEYDDDFDHESKSEDPLDSKQTLLMTPQVYGLQKKPSLKTNFSNPG